MTWKTESKADTGYTERLHHMCCLFLLCCHQSGSSASWYKIYDRATAQKSVYSECGYPDKMTASWDKWDLKEDKEEVRAWIWVTVLPTMYLYARPIYKHLSDVLGKLL